MPLIFSYGTLQQEQVQVATFGRRLAGEGDELPGFEPSWARREDGTTHANITFTGRHDSRVRGTVFEITDAELAATDRYEQVDAYERIAATLVSGKQAWVYVFGAPRTTTPAVAASVLGAIGNTPLVELRRIVPHDSGRVLAKLEWANPTGSMKDRMAEAAVQHAEADGRLRPGGTVVEYTSGTTGISLALVCAAKGYGLEIVYSDAFSDEKRRTMQAFGARVTDVRSDDKQITGALIKAMMTAAADIGQRPGHWYCDQLNNHDAIAGYVPLGEEIWRQADGRIDAFVHCVGTAHSIHGVTRALWQHAPHVRIVGVEPAESAVLSGQPSGAHKIEGIGIGFVPPLWQPELVNELQAVTTAEAKDMTRRLAREEGVFAGVSSGANVVAALRVARDLGPGASVVTIIVDSGLRYLSTDVFRGGP